MPAAPRRRRWVRNPGSSRSPSRVKGVRLTTKVLRTRTRRGHGSPRTGGTWYRGCMEQRAPAAYRLISADSHVNEPPDLWTVAGSRSPARPRTAHRAVRRGRRVGARGRQAIPSTFGMNACAGLEPEQMRGWVRFDDIRAGGYDPAARLEEMDRDGVDAEVLYPTPRLSQAIIANPDAEYHVAMVRGVQRLVVGVRRARAGALRRARGDAQPRRRAARSPRSTASSTVPACAGS